MSGNLGDDAYGKAGSEPGATSTHATMADPYNITPVLVVEPMELVPEGLVFDPVGPATEGLGSDRRTGF